jgi:hypothetical protein
MSNAASLVYTIPQGGAQNAALESAAQAVPIPVDVFQALGLRLVSDVTVVGPPVTRTINVSLVPVVAGTATATTLGSQPTGSPVEAVNVGIAGSGFVAPPGVQISDALGTGKGAAAKAFLDVGTIGVVHPGSGYSINTFAIAYGGLPPGNGGAGQTSFQYEEVLRAVMTAGGVGYSPRTTVTFVGGLSPRGRAATGQVVLQGGVIVDIVIDDEGDEYLATPQIVITDPTGAGSGASASAFMVPGKTVYFQGKPATIAIGLVGSGVAIVNPTFSGEGYISVPEIVVIDPANTGSGAVSVASMELNKIVVTNGGDGYQQPVVTLVPYFKTLFPDSGDQRLPLFNLMKASISKATRTQVIAAAPVMI